MDRSAADLGLFARFSAEAQARYRPEITDQWESSPFHWMRSESSRRKGAIGEAYVREWAEHEGMLVERALNSDHDCRLDGVTVEVKLSMRWESGVFWFEQIRDQDYEVAGLLGLEPERVRLWMVPKDILRRHSAGQHGGSAARDTRALRFKADAPPSWLEAYGGTLAKAKAALKQAARRRQ
jgi:hypothetical protein